MWDLFSRNVQQVLVRAQVEACKSGADFVGSEHLMLGLLGNRHNTACSVLKILGADLEQIQDGVRRGLPPGKGGSSGDFPFSARAVRVMEIAFTVAKSLDRPTIGSEHVLLGLLREEGSLAAKVVLKESGIGFSTVLGKIYKSENIQMDSLGQAREIVHDGLCRLQEEWVSSRIWERAYLVKIDEILDHLDYTADLLEMVEQPALKEMAMELKHRVLALSAPRCAAPSGEVPEVRTKAAGSLTGTDTPPPEEDEKACKDDFQITLGISRRSLKKLFVEALQEAGKLEIESGRQKIVD